MPLIPTDSPDEQDGGGVERPKKKSRKHRRIKSLRCYKQLHYRLVSGWTLQECARWLQKDKGECRDMTEGSLMVGLGRYRKDIPDQDLVIDPEDAVDPDDFLPKGLEELDEIERLYQMQLRRIEFAMGREQSADALDKHLQPEITTAIELLRRSHEMKMDLGLGGGKNLGTMTFRPELMVEINQKYGEDIGGAITDPESRNKVLSIARSLSEFTNLPTLGELFAGQADDQDAEG